MFNKPLNYFSNTPKTLNNFNPAFPQMGEVLTGWEFPLELIKVVQSVVSGDAVYNFQKINFLGVVQPPKQEHLEFLKIGERSWEWLWIHAKSSTLDLNTQDLIFFEKKLFKVMDKKDYHLNGFIEYFICRDYQEINLTF